MTKKIKIKAGNIEAIGELNNTRTDQAIWETLPIEAHANLRGDKTPMSKGNEIPPASAVTVFGKIIGDAAVFKQVGSGAKITIE